MKPSYMRQSTLFVSFIILFALYSRYFLLATYPQSTRYLNCSSTLRLGDDYGGWVLCPPKGSLRDALVYTIGVGRNIKWDEQMISKYSTIHHGWDPTPTAADYFSKRSIPTNFFFHPIGLGPHDGNLTLKLPTGNHDSYTVMEYHQAAQPGTIVNVPILTVPSMLRMLGHSRLAILKIDVEGAEFDVIQAWLEEKYQVPADQVLIEFHDRYFKNGRSLIEKALDSMNMLGYDVAFHTKLVRCSFYPILSTPVSNPTLRIVTNSQLSLIRNILLRSDH